MEKIITYSAQNYADALFKTGQNFENDLKIVLDVIRTSADFDNIISNPSVDLGAKFGILDEIFANRIAREVLQFIKILTEKGRLGELEGIYASYSQKVNDANNIQLAEVTSAIPLNDETKNRIIEKLNSKFNKKISASWVVNPDIISGLLFKVGDDIIDTTLITKVENIGKNIR